MCCVPRRYVLFFFLLFRQGCSYIRNSFVHHCSKKIGLKASLKDEVIVKMEDIVSLCRRRGFVFGSSEIYNGFNGFYDYGPLGVELKKNIKDRWWRDMVQCRDDIFGLDSSIISSPLVWEASGHVGSFSDPMVIDKKSGKRFRADQLVCALAKKENGEDLGMLTMLESDDCISDLSALAKKYFKDKTCVIDESTLIYVSELDGGDIMQSIPSPDDQSRIGDLTPPKPFNLMFETKIGPSGANKGFLRPETAQGLFVNFKRLLEYNSGKMPFAAAQIGLGFRNEIAPKNGLLRVREFTMAEIEHFVHPEEKDHPKFLIIADTSMVLFDRDAQMGSGKTMCISAGDAVTKKIINNQTLAYFMARTQLFAEKIGLATNKLRFRQHLKTEMAHYAADCWDLEVLTAYGWIECVGHADRACYDLKVHAKATNTVNEAQKLLDQPKEVTCIEFVPNRKLIGQSFKADQVQVHALLEEFSQDQLLKLDEELEQHGKAAVGKFEISRDMIQIKTSKKKVESEKYVPSVIEPSFGIGRLVHALLEHSFSQREGDEQRVVMRFKPNVAPVKCTILNLQSNAIFIPFVAKIENLLTAASIAHKTDTSGQSVGRRYARADEIGVPYGVTIDFQTVNDDSVTLRDRDSMAQVRVPISAIPDLLYTLCGRHASDQPTPWTQATQAFPKVDEQPAIKNGTMLDHTPRATFSRPAKPIL
mmetsp:Transcript_5401/g.7625  ORF Transcript_5401/g.7625 Transcript_5401/m.7625 type:complete len:703 (-) Transcript_5401:2154-4262(-)